MPMRRSHCDVLCDEGQIGDAVPEQPRREERLLSRPLLCADVEEEADQERDSDAQNTREEHVVGAGLQDPEDQEEHADRRQDRADGVEAAASGRAEADRRGGG